MFQQDGTWRIEHATVAFLERETPDFIPAALWLQNQPDLNPVDYSIWSVPQEMVYHSKITDLEELKTRLIDEWAQLDQSIVDAAIGQWRRRLHYCVHARGHISSINSNNVEPICRVTNCFLKSVIAFQSSDIVLQIINSSVM